MEVASLRTPNEAYLKSRRALVVASGLLLLSVFIGISPEASDGSFSVFSIRIKSPESIPTVFFVVLLYAIWQYWSSWFIQTDEARNFFVNRVDVLITLAIAFLSAISYLLPLVAAVLPFPKRGSSFFLSAIGAALAVSAFWYTNALIRKTFKLKAQIEESRLSSKLTKGSWILTFNPDSPSGKKEIRFESDGKIGIGHNDNEHRWRIREGTLEILNSSGNIFSRFRFNEQKDCLEHTNDPDTLSLRNQKLTRSQAGTSDGP